MMRNVEIQEEGATQAVSSRKSISRKSIPSIPSSQLGPLESEVSGNLRQWVSRSFVDSHVGIIVSDMSGFTRLTREHGIVHFTSIIVRMRQICLPILHRYG